VGKALPLIPVLACAWALGLPATAGPRAEADRVLDRFRPALVRIEVATPAGRVKGTGFFVSPDGELITNRHVLRAFLAASGAGSSARFQLEDGRVFTRFEIGRCAERDGVDLCLLRLPVAPARHLRPSARVTVGEGEAVYSIGNPGGTGLVSTPGHYLGTYGLDHLDQVEVTTPFAPGSSGGPILSARGELVGVATHFLRPAGEPRLRHPAAAAAPATAPATALAPAPATAGRRYLGISTRTVFRFLDGARKFLPAR
jgi:S1-C subfamily serine protease